MMVGNPHPYTKDVPKEIINFFDFSAPRSHETIYLLDFCDQKLFDIITPFNKNDGSLKTIFIFQSKYLREAVIPKFRIFRVTFYSLDQVIYQPLF